MTPQDLMSRRSFLVSTTASLAALRNAAGSDQQQGAGSNPPPATGQQASQAPPRTQPVDPEIIRSAEELAGIHFTDAERQMMSRTIADQVNILRSRQRIPLPPNNVGPAVTFDPRLPGLTFHANDFAPTWTEASPGPVPRDDADIAYAPVTSLAWWIRERELTSERLTDIYLERLKRIGPKLECVITLTEDLAREQARLADREIKSGRWRGPLHGVPWGAKDLLDTAGIATTWGAEPYRSRVPDQDAAVVRLLQKAGAVLVAKLSLGALAYDNIWHGGKTRNPWNIEQGSSGSSAGSAAATAAGLVGFSIGTETLGSIVSPSMRCGVTGLRPTFGRVSRAGAMALCWSLDKIGPMCRTVEDCMMVLSAINGTKPDVDDPCSLAMPLRFRANASVRGMTVGFNPRWFSEDSANDIDRRAFDVARHMGLRLVEIDLPDWPYDVLLTILLCEAAAAFEELTRSNRDDELTWQAPEAWPNTFRQSWFLPGIELVQAQRFRTQVCRMMADLFQQKKLDAIIAPSYAASLLLITNNTGHPSLTIRAGFQQERPGGPETPHGITLIGNLFGEAVLCRIGMELERRLNVWGRRPPVD